MNTLLIILGVLAVAAFLFRGAMGSAYEEVQVVEVVDGDTIVVTNRRHKEGVRVNLIGINTPEHARNSLEPDEYYAKDATHYVQTRLRNAHKIYLEYDKDRWDNWGNMLAYIYLTKSGSSLKSLNAELVAKGYARVEFKAPNLRYQQSFLKLEAKAKKQRLGIWRRSNNNSSF